VAIVEVVAAVCSGEGKGPQRHMEGEEREQPTEKKREEGINGKPSA